MCSLRLVGVNDDKVECNMKIARVSLKGKQTFGFLVDGGFVDRRTVGVEAESIQDLIASGLPDASRIADADVVPLDQVELLAPLERGKVICAGVNFQTHRDEAALSTDRPPFPTIFSRFPDSHVAHGQPLVKPFESKKFDYEGELAVIIGRSARRVSVESALDHVFGYSCYNDGSARDWQMHTPQWIPGKNFYHSGAVGPSIVTVDEVPEIGSAWLETRVNGEVRQRAQIDDMIFSIAELISYISTFTVLEPGDVIAAGTPGGVGLFMEPQTFLTSGDIVEVEVDGVGLLSNRVVEG